MSNKQAKTVYYIDTILRARDYVELILTEYEVFMEDATPDIKAVTDETITEMFLYMLGFLAEHGQLAHMTEVVQQLEVK